MNFMRWAVLLPFFLFLSACQSEKPSGSGDGSERPPFVLSEPIPLPGNHHEIPITIDPNRKSGDGQNQDSKSETESKAGGGDPNSKTDDKPKTMFDPENLRVKPGHWIAVQSEGESTQEDFSGQLQYSMRRGDFDPRLIPGTRYFQRSHRPANLAKEQKKRFETPLFVVRSSPMNILPELLTRSGGVVANRPERFLGLENHQYHCVVLSDRPDTYNFLSVLPSIRNLKLNQLLGEGQDFSDDDPGMTVQDYSNSGTTFHIDSLYYKLTLSRWESEVELPSNAQQWTSIAYLLWSDFAPDRLSPDQQVALVDWLHFGGQLIVSGDGLDALNSGFLKEYLPVRPVSSKNESCNALLPMMEKWGLHRAANGQLILPAFADTDTFVRSVWELEPSASEIPGTNGLVVERQIGKGRIVATAFPLNMTRLRGWTSLDHWFNSCLLRRPGRNHRSEDEIINIQQPWQMQGFGPLVNDETDRAPSTLTGFNWLGNGLSAHLPSVFSTINFASRDWRVYEPISTSGGDPETSINQVYLPAFNRESRRFALGSTERSQGEWDDYSEISRAARSCLKEQAGITPPSREWVLQALLIYLAVLVPINYVIFRLARRLELAWFSIPLIAIVGAVMVVRAASLDIGFSNKNLQVNLIEVPTNYSRGHLTGYGSLYSSLTSQFRFESENPTTLALPFPSANQLTEVSETPAEFRLEFGRPVRFGPQQVLSNTMEMYQFQQMIDLDGVFGFQAAADATSADRVDNRTKLNLFDVGLFKLDADGQTLMFARLAKLPAGTGESIPWQVLDQSKQLPTAWQGTCLEDRTFKATEVVALFADKQREPFSLTWLDAVNFLREQKSEVADALQEVAQRRSLAADIKLTPELLDSALQEIAPPGLSLGSLFRAATRYPIGPGEVRMVGWTDEAVDQWDVLPAASQSEQRSLVIAHLAQPMLPAVGFDNNLAYPPRNSKPEDNVDSEDSSTTLGEQPVGG